jgi:alkylation response protein AidB-like acyl-CoA dehydrogenase
MFGGYELPLEEAVSITATLAEGCGSTGWVQGVYADHCATLGMFPGGAQTDVWGESPDSLISSGFKPSGNAVPVDGGYRLSGRWPFSSGCDYADWVFLRSIVPAGPKGEAPDLCMFLVPKKDYTIIDNWHVMGLNGTGSKDIEINGEVFVPQHRVLSNEDLANGTGPGSDFNGGLLYRLPRMATVPFSLSAPLIGIAQHALQTFIQSMKARASVDPRAAQEGAVQMRVAHASAEIDSSRALMLQDCREAMETLRRGVKLTLEQRARNRRDIAYIAYLCTRAVDRLFASAGGSAIYLSADAQRQFRDIHAAGGHISLSWDVSGTNYGKVIFGVAPGRPV